jgi:hypothetical protein
LFREWANEDSAQALAAALQTPEAAGMGVLYPIFSLLVKREGFESAMARLEAAEDGSMKQEGYRYLAQEVFQTPNPQSCMELLLERSPKEAVGAALGAGVQSWRMVASLEEVWTWVESKKDQIDAAAIPDLERAVAAGTIDKNPEKGAAWLLERATDGSRPGHLRTIAERWARNAPNAAGKWLKALPQGPQNDEALEAFVMAVFRDDPESAAHWAVTISDEGKRRSSLDRALSIWRGVDATAAEAFAAKAQNR